MHPPDDLLHMPGSSQAYKLMGLISGAGTTLQNGHFVTLSRQHGSDWLSYDDGRVSRVTSEPGKMAGGWPYRESYILFYRKVNGAVADPGAMSAASPSTIPPKPACGAGAASTTRRVPNVSRRDHGTIYNIFSSAGVPLVGPQQGDGNNSRPNPTSDRATSGATSGEMSGPSTSGDRGTRHGPAVGGQPSQQTGQGNGWKTARGGKRRRRRKG